VSFDRKTCRWHIIGEADEVRRQGDRYRVLKALQDAPVCLWGTSLVWPSWPTYLLLKRMADDGEVVRLKQRMA
jgi:hypothetical protein